MKNFKKYSFRKKYKTKENFDENAQKEFLKGAKIAYETIITDFSDNDNKITRSKSFVEVKIFMINLMKHLKKEIKEVILQK